MRPTASRLAISLCLLLAPGLAFANPGAQIATGLYNYFLAGVGVFTLLALVYLGYMVMLNRQPGQVAITVVIGMVSIALVGAFTAAAQQESSSAIASIWLGELVNAARITAIFALVISGIRYLIDGSSSNLLFPILMGYVVIEASTYFAGALGYG